MFFGLGFLLAMLMMLAFMPAVQRTRRAADAPQIRSRPAPAKRKCTPQKDRLRADFAMSTHKLEQTIDEMQQKIAAHGTDLARKAATVTQLKETLDARDAIIAQLQGDAARARRLRPERGRGNNRRCRTATTPPRRPALAGRQPSALPR